MSFVKEIEPRDIWKNCPLLPHRSSHRSGCTSIRDRGASRFYYSHSGTDSRPKRRTWSEMLVHKVLATVSQSRQVIRLHSIRPNLNGGMIRAQGSVPYSTLHRALNAIRMASPAPPANLRRSVRGTRTQMAILSIQLSSSTAEQPQSQVARLSTIVRYARRRKNTYRTQRIFGPFARSSIHWATALLRQSMTGPFLRLPPISRPKATE